MKKILYVNACVKRDSASRTSRLAQAYLNKCLAYQDCSLSALDLEDIIMHPLTGKYLTEREKAVYLTTSGGYIGGNNFGFDYVKGVFSMLFGIAGISFYSAEGLDIYGNDPEQILAGSIEKMLKSQA